MRSSNACCGGQSALSPRLRAHLGWHATHASRHAYGGAFLTGRVHAARPSVNAATVAPPREGTDTREAALLAQLNHAIRQRRNSSEEDSPGATPPAPQSPARNATFFSGQSQPWDLPTGLAVTWLGTSSGSPTRERNISCTLVRCQEAMYMVDVGEGSYRQFQLTGMELSQVESIFITHMHGDHCFGLASMLMALDAAKQHLPDPVQRATHVVGPPGLLMYLEAVLVLGGLAGHLHNPVYVTELTEGPGFNGSPEAQAVPCPMVSALHPGCHQPVEGWGGKVAACQLLPDAEAPPPLPPSVVEEVARMGLRPPPHLVNHPRMVQQWQAKHHLSWTIPCHHSKVKAAQLQHRVPCWGYVFEEGSGSEQQQQEGVLSTTAMQPFTPSSSSSSKGPASVETDGVAASRSKPWPAGAAAGAAAVDDSTAVPARRKVAILGDTMNSRAIIPWAWGADVLAHEATFARGMEPTAWKAQHSTAWMAGQFARIICVQQLVLTHFSARNVKQPPFSRSSSSAGGGGGSNSRTFGGKQQQHNHSRGGRYTDDAAEEEACSRSLYSEAVQQFGSNRVLMARDLFTVHVPKQKKKQQQH